jgi:hypothetical protein
MAVYRPDILPHVAQLIGHLPPELKRSVKQAVRSLSSNPFSGEPLLRELAGRGNTKSDDFASSMKSIAKHGSSGSSRWVTGERFTKNWLTDSATPDDVNRVTTGKQSRVVKA